jgi:hypothetical protein
MLVGTVAFALSGVVLVFVLGLNGVCLPRAAPTILRMTFLAIIVTLGAWAKAAQAN